MFPLGLSALALGACAVPADDEAALDPADETAQVEQGLTVPSFSLGARRLFSHTDEGGRAQLIGDVNGDHCADLVYAGSTSTSVYLSNCAGGFGARIVSTVTSQGERLARLGDIDGDGDQDLVYLGEASTGVFLSKRDGTWSYAGVTTHTTEGGYRLTGDVNGDGRSDLIFSQAGTLRSAWYPSLGNGTFGARTTTGDAFMHVDQRHYEDLLYYISVSGVTALKGEIARVDPYTLVPWRVTSGADYTGAGARKVTTFFPGRLDYDLNGTKKSLAHGYGLNQVGMVADVTGDGRDDALYVGTSSVVAFVSNGTGFLPAVQVKLTNESAKHPMFADANGDGILDLHYIGSTSVAIYPAGVP